MSTSPTRPHQHEAWQIRTTPDGERYCVACGQKIEEAA